MQILYQREVTGEGVALILSARTFSDEDGEPSEFCRALLAGVDAHQTSIDATIERTSEHWTLGRMPLVDRNILRIAVYELLYEDAIPDSVTINEAVELAKTYGGDDSSKFVNGILGKIAERATGGPDETDPETE